VFSAEREIAELTQRRALVEDGRPHAGEEEVRRVEQGALASNRWSDVLEEENRARTRTNSHALTNDLRQRKQNVQPTSHI
jgi:hypothetical protein